MWLNLEAFVLSEPASQKGTSGVESTHVRDLESSDSHRQKVGEGVEMVFSGAEFQFYRMKRVLWMGAVVAMTAWMYVMPAAWTFKNGGDGESDVMYVLPQLQKKFLLAVALSTFLNEWPHSCNTQARRPTHEGDSFIE